ncbi:hypothetical protein LY78DRAFT_375782 [Colletotrichum sublineola]|nr:hypothetical protein LY78DRAFT_375782 [Colletotrichum sublineola]
MYTHTLSLFLSLSSCRRSECECVCVCVSVSLARRHSRSTEEDDRGCGRGFTIIFFPTKIASWTIPEQRRRAGRLTQSHLGPTKGRQAMCMNDGRPDRASCSGTWDDDQARPSYLWRAICVKKNLSFIQADPMNTAVPVRRVCNHLLTGPPPILYFVNGRHSKSALVAGFLFPISMHLLFGQCLVCSPPPAGSLAAASRMSHDSRHT